MGCFVHRFLISSPNLRITAGFCLGMVSPATGIEDAGGDWYHEGGIILSKKPPEWHLSPPLHEFSASDSNFFAAKKNGPPAAAVAATIFRVRFKFLCSKEEWPACYNIAAAGKNGPTAE